MRSRLPAAVFAGFVLLGLQTPDLQASCATPTPMSHAFDSYFLCDEFLGPTGAFAYQLSNPVGVNTGAEDILCLSPDEAGCSTPGSANPDAVTIETDWMNPGTVGCPLVPSGPQRVVIAVSIGSARQTGSALLVSLSGANPDVGYSVEMAHPFDPQAIIFPVECGQTMYEVSASAGHVLLHFTHPPVHTDCDPDSVGMTVLSGTTCPDAFSPSLSFGPVYTRVQPCSARVDVRREAWSPTGVTPAADGWATILLDPSPSGQCTFIGSTTILNGVETPIITGFALSDVDWADIDGDGHLSCGPGCGPDCDDHDAAVHPGATETCNGIDDDCDGQVDEGLDSDGDTVSDCVDNCPSVANITQADRDGDSVGDFCDNCLEVFNPDQRDMDNDGFGDICDTCSTIPNPDQNGCVCDNCEMPAATISFSSPLSKGSGLVTWTSPREVELIGFNVVEFTNKGERIQLNRALIRCEECITGLGHLYTFIIPKHKSGRNIFIEFLQLSGTVQTIGPAQRVP